MTQKGFLLSYQRNRHSFAVVLFLLLSFPLYATNWYVDKNASGSNNGTSWANAWKSFSSINWSSIHPGDYLYISGGSDSTVYYEQLTPAANGTASNNVYIMSGKYSPSPNGHSGRVIIEGTGSRSIYIGSTSSSNPRRYLYLKGFECRNSEQGIYIDDYDKCITIDSMYIYDYRGQAGIMLSGASTYTIDSTTIKNCKIVSPGNYNGETDGVYAQRCQRTLFHNNYVHQRNQDPNAHTDCLQAYLTNGWVIYDNYFINDSVYSPEGGGTPMILGSEGTNPVIIYNNFLYMGGIWDPSGNMNSCLWTRWYDNNPMPPTWVIHNTIVVNGPRCRSFIQEYDAITINNIMAEFSTSGGMVNLEESLPHAIPVDSTRHNLFWRSWSGAGFSGQFTGNGHTGTPSGWSSWTGTYGGTGVNADPLFVHKFGYEPDQGALDGELKVGSPAFGVGEDAKSYINNLNKTYNLTGDWALQWKDINGNPRNNTPTIGAYEYSNGGNRNNSPNPPSNPNPSNGAINQPIDIILNWTCIDLDGDPLTYDVYFGTSSNPAVVASNQSGSSYNPGLLTGSATYYWKIVAKDNHGATTEGPVWNFTSINPDITPPELISASIMDSSTVELIFSEALESTSSQSASNYYISNNVNVISAQLSYLLNKVTLHTSPHTSGSYTVMVQNVKDQAGNNISPQHNTLDYSYTIDNVPPDIYNLTVTNTKSITINFTEKINPVDAKNKKNYSISNNISVNSVQLMSDSMTVVLKTTNQQRNKDYEIIIANIEDRSGNLISPNPKVMFYRLPRKGTGYAIQNPIQRVVARDWSQSYLPEKIIDGEGMNFPSSRWMSSSVMPDTLKLDMGSVHPVDSLRISFYKWESNRLYKYSVYASEDSISWSPIVEDVWSDSLEWSALQFDSTRARFVKLILKESNQSPWASIWEVELFGPQSDLNPNKNIEVSEQFILLQNYPNPFNPSTKIQYTVNTAQFVSLKVYDILGNEIKVLVDEVKSAGNYEVEFKADNLAAGVYIYRLRTDSFTDTKKMVLLK